MECIPKYELVEISAGFACESHSKEIGWYIGYVSGSISWYFTIPGSSLTYALLSQMK